MYFVWQNLDWENRQVRLGFFPFLPSSTLPPFRGF